MKARLDARIKEALELAALIWSIGSPLGILMLIARLTGQVRVVGLENLNRRGGFVIAANHKSIWEVFLIPLLFFPRFLFDFSRAAWNVAATENFKDKWWWRWAHRRIIFIERGNGRAALEATYEMARVVLAGWILLLFPEGGRTWSKKPHEQYRFSLQRHVRIRCFKVAGLERILRALKGQALIVVPVWVERSEDVRPNTKGWLDRWEPVQFIIGEAIIFQPGTSGEEMARRLEEAVLALADRVQA